jgi:hypothetical protein
MIRKILIIIGIVVVIIFINNLMTNNTTTNLFEFEDVNIFDENIEDGDVEDVSLGNENGSQNNPPLFTSSTVFIHVPDADMLPTCEDHTLLVPKQVSFSPTSAVLTSSISELMLITEDSMDEQAQNWVSNERGFSLESVTIENGIAKIFLTHPSAEPYTSPCQKTWMKFQLRETASQFPTVSLTQVFVNGEMI